MQVNHKSGHPALSLSSVPHRAWRRWSRWRVLLLGVILCGLMQACSCDKPPCDKPSDCPTDQGKCFAGYCHKPCSTNQDCASGERCFSGVCLDPSTEPQVNEDTTDSNVDAGGSDDAKKPDVSKDAGGSDDGKTPDQKVTPDDNAPDTPTPGDNASPDQKVTPDNASPENPTDSTTTPDAGPDAGPDATTSDSVAGECRAGETRPCYNALPQTKGVGPCKEGKETCGNDNKWGACIDEVLPELEKCDGKDNDCDGKTDEDFPQKGQACQVSAGECAGTGVYACTPDGRTLFCEVKGKQSAPEVCDGKDNDCDGLVDEDFKNLGTACFDGQGACRRQGAFVCASDGKSTECTAKKGPSYKERCNGRDDDCDGSVDEDFTTKGNTCNVGVGECRNTGKLVCNSAGNGVECNVKAGTPSPEVCDGKDNDCNGKTDDNIATVKLCSNQVGVCKGAKQKCVAGAYVPCTNADYTAHNSKYQTNESKCDTVDNDCDGQTDEGFAKLGVACTISQCSAPPGKQVCDPSDDTKLVCDIKLRKETCANFRDDNCDGTLDEGCPACMPQTSQPCYFGPPGTEGIGICSGSSQSCEANGKWGDCPEWNGPRPETCNNTSDEDCDGISGKGCGDCPFVKDYATYKGHTGTVFSVASYFSNLITASGDNTARIWSTRTYRTLYTLTGHTGAVTSAAYNGNRYLTGSADKTIRKWNFRGVLERTFTGHTDSVTDLKYDRQGKFFVSASLDKTIRVWDSSAVSPATGLIATLNGHTAGVNAIDVDIHLNYIVSAGADGTVRLWDRKTNKQIGKSLTCAKATDVVFYPDGSMIGAACDTVFLVWVVKTIVNTPGTAAAPLRTFTPPVLPRIGADNATSLEFTADGDHLIGGTANGRVIQYNFATTAVIESHTGHTSAVTDIHRANDNKGFITASKDNSAKHWGCAAFLPTSPACTPNNRVRIIANAHTVNANVVAFSRFDRFVFSGGSDKLLRQYNVSTGALVRTFTGHTGFVSGVDVSLDGKTLVSSSLDGTVRIWEVSTGKLLHTVTYTDGSGRAIPLVDVDVSDGGVIAAPGGNDVFLSNMSTGAKIATLTGHTAKVNAVSFSPNGSFYLASGSEDGSVRVYTRSTPSYRFSRSIAVEMQGGVGDVVINRSSRIITLSGSPLSNLRVYRTNGALERNMSRAPVQQPFRRLAVSYDANFVAATNADGRVYFWRSTGSFFTGLNAHSSIANGFAWSNSGQIGASASADLSIRIHDCQLIPQ